MLHPNFVSHIKLLIMDKITEHYIQSEEAAA